MGKGPQKRQHYEARKRGPDGALLPFVANVTWRRSGHTLLRTLLRRTLGLRFGYCEFYFPGGDPELRCCETFPCRKAGRINMSRQHDVDLTAALPEGHPLVVLTRTFATATAAHFAIRARQRNTDDTREAFLAFADERLTRFRAFRSKWIDTPRENRVLLTFEDMLADRVAAVERVLPLYGVSVPSAQIAEQVAAVPALEVRDVTRFKYYDEALFGELNARAAGSG